MLKLLVAVVTLVALGIAAALVPVRGSTILERWAVAPSTGVFLERGWHEAKQALGLEKERGRPARNAARPQRTPPRAARNAAPAERHTDDDRAALDRIVADHAR
jgi:hypothetical protein